MREMNREHADRVDRAAFPDAPESSRFIPRRGSQSTEPTPAKVELSVNERGGSFVTEADGSLHVVDYAGVRLLSQGRAGWDTAMTGGTWGAWREFAATILLLPDPEVDA